MSAGAQPGKAATFSFNSTGMSTSGLSVAFLSGVAPKFATLGSDGSATIPDGLQGTVYAIVTNNSTGVADADTVAGPAIMSFPFDSFASNPQ